MAEAHQHGEDVPFSLMCACGCGCDAGMEVASREEAERGGWRDIEHDDGPTWNHLGICPECIRDCGDA